jgi:hypothetical protein
MGQAVEVIPNDSPVTLAIRLRMDQVRSDLDEDVQEIVEGARDMGQWRHYVKSYPWVCAGLAVAAGYLIVPRRAVGMLRDSSALAQLASQGGQLATSHLLAKGSVGGKLLELAADLALRGISRYVAQQAGNLFATPVAGPTQREQA